MLKTKALLLTQGMHGMISQVEGLAKALNINFTHRKVELKSFWKFIPPSLTPKSNISFKEFEIPDFDLIISCGRKSVIPSIYLKKNGYILINEPETSFFLKLIQKQINFIKHIKLFEILELILNLNQLVEIEL